MNMTLRRENGQSRWCWKGKRDQNTLCAHMTFSKNIFKIIKSKKKVSHGPTPSLAPRDVAPFLTDSEQEDTDCLLQFYRG